jgi:hypothetical protein
MPNRRRRWREAPEVKTVAGWRGKKEKRELRFCVQEAGEGERKKNEGCRLAVGQHPKKSISNVARANSVTNGFFFFFF